MVDLGQSIKIDSGGKKTKEYNFSVPDSSEWMHIPKSGGSSLEHSSFLIFKA